MLYRRKEIPELYNLKHRHDNFDEYVEYNMDCSDLKDKIVWLLDEERWREWGSRSLNSYENYHTPKDCFIQYYNNIIRHVPLQRLTPIPVDPFEIFKPNRV